MSSDTAKTKEEREYWQQKIQYSDGLWKTHLEKTVDLLSRHSIAKRYLENGETSLTGFHPSEPTARYKLNFDKSQTIFHNTAYEKEVKGKRFVHFTSFQACMEILGSGQIRLYNPNFGNDPNEVIYAAKKAFNSGFELEYAIKELFALSLCDESVLKDLTMWRLYGKEGNGVALILEMENEEANWDDWYFGKVQYGATNELSALNAFHEDMKSTFGENKKPNIVLDLKPLYAFHKTGVFHSEAENRLVFKNNFSAGDHQYNDDSRYGTSGFETGVTVKKVLTRDFRECYYCTYPLYWAHSNKELEENAPLSYQYGPRIRLKGIELGYKYSDADVAKLSLYAHTLISDRFPADHMARTRHPEVSVSALKGQIR